MKRPLVRRRITATALSQAPKVGLAEAAAPFIDRAIDRVFGPRLAAIDAELKELRKIS